MPIWFILPDELDVGMNIIDIKVKGKVPVLK